MRVTDLMIGDWVQNTNGDRGKFSAMIHFADNNTCKFVVKYGENDVGYSAPSLIEPIPITPELMEKNGFTKSRVGWIKKTYGAWDISVYLSQYAQIEITNYCGRGTDCEEVNYGSTIKFDHNISVHELQHALRICGLNELADNFKI